MSNLTRDHVGLSDTFASRRYFKKFEGIMQHMLHVAGVQRAEGALDDAETEILTRYAAKLTHTFKALGMKYLLAGRETGRFFGSLTMDARDSGFPVAEEIMTMANDAQQARGHLDAMASVDTLKDQMVQTMLGERRVPTKLQFALSQRLYYEELAKGDLFWVQNDVQSQWMGNLDVGRRQFRLHWATYDSQVNLPVIYMMELEDSGDVGLPKDQRRWPEVQAHLSAQALGGLKLLTIAKGFDEDFDDLHPKRLRRFHLGPMYSNAYTRQAGPLREVLAEARAPDGQDWALVWTEEELVSDRVIEQKSGWFSTVEREVFALDPFAAQGPDLGATRQERSIILPTSVFQVLDEKQPAGFGSVRKFVVSSSGRVLQY
ncbi:hypothetical protein Z946_1397 [Sulfitobacter noctilucicola]|uniref:Uncharacterized protein n=1 Tax=Sulfitobacter noctilucicola TaxID=1342301 RepID=A0A7W6M6C0_9RHOB|nr:hypothetical protein [Sulfitobacter noctilucicola]KIN62537.1 hypothetical protein Z946_1397 [Sulfitobacter noctilucicola]MBB4172932.1 hypothetical protein [Sulfitobacter noctilucicola]